MAHLSPQPFRICVFASAFSHLRFRICVRLMYKVVCPRSSAHEILMYKMGATARTVHNYALYSFTRRAPTLLEG